MSIPEISVVIPHLNQPDHLQSCLLSLTSQAFDRGDVEIIVIDNGSPTLPSDVCSRFANVRLESEPDPGPGPARNWGVACSTAPILAFIDADCIADPHWLEAIFEALGETGSDVVGGNVRIAMADPSSMTMIEAYECVYAFRQADYIRNQGFSATLNMAMRRDVFDQVGGFGGIEIAEDRDWGRRAQSLGIGIRFVPEMLVHHPARGSLSELFRKWDRLISHDYEQISAHGGATKVRWALRALAIGLSSPADLGRIVFTGRLSGARQRVMAFWVLTLVRAYRARVMIGGLLGTSRGRSRAVWNQR